MEFLEGLLKAKKMCSTYYICDECPIDEVRGAITCPFASIPTKNVTKRIAKIVEDWKPPVDWSKVAVDTPILVWDDFTDKHKRHFAKYENGLVYAWDGGGTSWTEEDVTDWKHAELAEVD